MSFQKFSLHVLPVNDGPVISAISDQNTIQDMATAPIPFTIADIDSQSLTLWYQISDASLVDSIHFHDINPNGQVQISPGDIYDISLTVIPHMVLFPLLFLPKMIFIKLHNLFLR
jgi:hypothetical protein